MIWSASAGPQVPTSYSWSGVASPRKEIRPLHLSREKAQLKAFLLTLTGEPVLAERLVDTHEP